MTTSGTHLSRRNLLALAATGMAVGGCSYVNSLSGGGGNVSSQGSAGFLLKSERPLPTPFTRRLPIPPVLTPTKSDATTDYYELTQRAGAAQILDDVKTEVWGYDGVFPGPTIVSRRGRKTIVRHRNELPVPVVVHLHGGRVAPEHDGYPTDLLLPAGGHATHTAHAGDTATGSRDYVYDLDQPAATLWYHDHRMDFTGPQVYRGLAGFHLHRDDVEEGLNLPSGDRDIPLMITDRSFAANGAFLYPSLDPTLTRVAGVTDDHTSGVLGDCVLVNGAPWPVLEVAAVRYRFRLLNASNARRYKLKLEDGPPFVQIGSDLGLLAAPIEHDEIDIAQAEHFDVVVDFSGSEVGDEITMVNTRGDDDASQVMLFRVTSRGVDSSSVPSRLADVEVLKESDAVAEREFTFLRAGGLWTVNSQPFSPDLISAHPRLGTVERWKIRAANVEHPFHVHLAGFQVLTRNGNDERGAYNSGWKDTVNLDNGGSADLLVRFDGFRGKYVLHCHNLEHEDMMMMANIEIV